MIRIKLIMEKVFGIAIFFFGVVLAVGMIWLQKRLKIAKKVPYTPLMILGFIVAAVGVVYLLGVFGFKLPRLRSFL